MKIPAITGVIRRRILLNYRVDPEVVQKVLPCPFRPKLVGGVAIAGICLIRLEEIRPKGLPEFVGVSSENSAHRIAVEWEDGDEQREGVFVPRRDTDSHMNALLGGRLFPGVHHHSEFHVHDDEARISLRVKSADSESPLVELSGEEATEFPTGSVFGSLQESSQFFEAGCVGYSFRQDSCLLEGLLLHVEDWQVSHLRIEEVHSAYFDDESLFPAGSIEYDHALLMRDIPHVWHSEPAMMAEEAS